MGNNQQKYEQIIELNTRFLVNSNRIDHAKFTNELENHLYALRDLMGFDAVNVLQPLNLDSRLECFPSITEEDMKNLDVISKMDKNARAEALNSITGIVEYGKSSSECIPMFDPEIFKQVIAYPIINGNKVLDGNGGVFFLNKSRKFDLTPLMTKAITIVCETITMAYNSYRKKQLYDSSYNIFQKTQESSKRGVCIYTVEGIILFANKYFYELIGRNENEVFGKNIMDYLRLKNHKTIKDIETLAGVPSQPIMMDDEGIFAELLRPNGDTILIRKYYEPIILERKWHKMLVIEDITKEIETIDIIEQNGMRDSLTGLKNRSCFQKDINDLLAPEKLPVAAIVGDINGLKLMNDIFGHEYGDLLLKKLSGILEHSCENCEVYRVGGDEFYIFLNNSSQDAAEEFIAKVNSDCNKEFKKLNFIGISMGYEIVAEQDIGLENAVRKAETDMYYVKSLSSEAIKNESISSLKSLYLDRFKSEKDRVLRMVEVAREFSTYIELRPSEVTDLCNSLELLDIGKVSINQFVVDNDRVRTEDEFENMKKHCRIGYKIASLSYETSHLARVILNHHENWDGSGFPQGIKGNAIPFISRIIRIIEYYDRLISNNSQIENGFLIKELENKKGRIFDPLITDKFIKYIKSFN